jgi:hypothetical protein
MTTIARVQLNEVTGRESQGAYRHDELIGAKVTLSSVEICSCEKWVVGSWSRGQFRNPEQGKRRLLEAATERRLMKTDKTYVL